MRQSVQEALDLSVDLVTTAGIEDAFYKEIAGTDFNYAAISIERYNKL